MADARPPVSYKYKFKPGQTWTYLVTVDGQVVVATPQGNNSNPVKIRMKLAQKVLGVSEGIAEIEIHIVSARSFTDGQPQTLPEEGQKFTMTLDPRGNLVKSSVPLGNPGTEWAQMVFPDRPLEVGHDWTQETRSSQGMGMITKTHYTLAGFEKLEGAECAVFTSDLVIDGGAGNPAKPDAKTSGKTWFDAAAGLVVRTAATSHFSFRVPVPDDPAVMLTSTTTLKIEMTLER